MRDGGSAQEDRGGGEGGSMCQICSPRPFITLWTLHDTQDGPEVCGYGVLGNRYRFLMRERGVVEGIVLSLKFTPPPWHPWIWYTGKEEGGFNHCFQPISFSHMKYADTETRMENMLNPTTVNPPLPPPRASEKNIKKGKINLNKDPLNNILSENA